MIELPEVLTLCRQLNEHTADKTVANVYPPTKPHKFCWFNGDVADYEKQLQNSRIMSVDAFGLYVEISFENGRKLCINDGVNVRLTDITDVPKNYQLLITFTDNTALVFTVAMYGGIVLHDGLYDNEYYIKSKNYISPFDKSFKKYFDKILSESKNSLSAKAFIATEQRFPGIGNGVSQDILFTAHIHPKRKICTLSASEKESLYEAIVTVLKEMTNRAGRDTEKDIFGNVGGYKTKMSKNTLGDGCPVCSGEIIKESYLGGSVYYCPKCQPLIK